MISKKLLTTRDVADLLQVKESTVRTWINDLTLRAVKFGKEWRVQEKDLEIFLEERANRPRATSDGDDNSDTPMP